jgi:hypothetical protein
MLASKDKPWFALYKAAILELDTEKLPERIVAANAAVRLRLKEIEGDSGHGHHAERRDIEDALSSLKALTSDKGC